MKQAEDPLLSAFAGEIAQDDAVKEDSVEPMHLSWRSLFELWKAVVFIFILFVC